MLVAALVMAAGLVAAAIAQAAATGAKLKVTGAVHGSYRIAGNAGGACSAHHFGKQEQVTLSFGKNGTTLDIISTPGHQPTGKINLATTTDWTVLFATEMGGGDVVWQSGDGLGAGREGTGTLSLAKGYESGKVTAFMPPAARTVPGVVSPAASSQGAVQIKASWDCG